MASCEDVSQGPLRVDLICRRVAYDPRMHSRPHSLARVAGHMIYFLLGGVLRLAGVMWVMTNCVMGWRDENSA